MDTRSRYHADAEASMTDKQRQVVDYLAGGSYYILDGVLPDGDLFIYCDHGHAYYRVTRAGNAYEVTEQAVDVPALV